MNKFNLPVGNPTLTPPVPELTDLVIGETTFKVNKDGDAIGEDGKIVKTKAELETLKTSASLSDDERAKAAKLAERSASIEASLVEGAEVELDGVKYTVEKDGSIKKDGNVFKTKAELKTLLLAQDDGEPEVNYISELQKVTNFIPVGSDNTPVAYENTLEGMTQYIQDLQKASLDLGKTQSTNELFTKFPILSNIIDHLTVHGNLEQFTEQVDYSTITIKEDDENQQIDIYTRAKTAQGVPAAEIADMIKYLKEDKKLKDAAVSSLSYLKTRQEADKTKLATDAAAVKAAQEAANKAYWNEINGIFTNKQLKLGDKNFKIPDIIQVKEANGKIVTKTIDDFKKYIEQPLTFTIDNKSYIMTQHDYDEYIESTQRTPHNDLFEAYRRFTKYDDSQLIAANVNNNAVKQILKINTKSASGGSGTQSKGKIVLPIH
jgi:hypothetical protein